MTCWRCCVSWELSHWATGPVHYVRNTTGLDSTGIIAQSVQTVKTVTTVVLHKPAWELGSDYLVVYSLVAHRDPVQETIFTLIQQIAPEADLSALSPDDDMRDALSIDSFDHLNIRRFSHGIGQGLLDVVRRTLRH